MSGGPGSQRVAAGPGGLSPRQIGWLKLQLLATAACWGANVPVVKLLQTWFEPLALSALRVAVSSTALLAVVAWQWHRALRPWPRFSARIWVILALCGVLMVYGNQLCFAWGVKLTAATNAALILALNPLGTTLGAALLGERLSGRRLAGLVIGFGGVAAVVLSRPGASLGGAALGDLLMLGAVATWAFGGLAVQRLTRPGGADPAAPRPDTEVVSAATNLAGGLALALHVGLSPGIHLPDPARVPWLAWLLLLASALLAVAWGALVWNRGLQVLGAQRTSLFVYWVPIFGVSLSVGLLGEPLSVWHGVGLAGVLAGTWLGTGSAAPRPAGPGAATATGRP